MRRKLFGLGVFFVTILSAPLANADNFSFSFTGLAGIGFGFGDVAGTVSGEILGLTNNSTGPAADVLITSFPTGLDSVLGAAGTGPIDTMLWTNVAVNTFTEFNGVLTGGSFVASETVNGFSRGGQLWINGTDKYGSHDFLNLDGQDNLYVWNHEFAAVTTAPLGPTDPQVTPGQLVATPEPPGGVLLLATGSIAVFGVWRRKQQA